MTQDCTTCQLARWQRTKAGRLHPSGDGRCSWEGWKEWKMPKAFYGGYINHSTPWTDCPLYQPIATPTPPQQ